MVAVNNKYEVIDPATGQLDRRVFVDPDIYAEEQEKVFGRAWLMIGHESLVPKPNDFFHTYMGEEPVILTRDGNGELHAFLNMCRHRGNRVVRTDLGNAANFACAYHGWTYSNDGSLEYVPGEEEAYYGGLDRGFIGADRGAAGDLRGYRFRLLGRERPDAVGVFGRRPLVLGRELQPDGQRD